jgi:hypothetical protein
MKLQYDADLIEGAVFLEAHRLERNGQRLLALRYLREREGLYEVKDADDRNDAFYKLHRKWFTDFSLEDRILAVVKQFPLIEKSAATLLLRKSVIKKDEGAELFVRPDAKNVVVALRAERFVEGQSFDAFLRHELTHISDMLDPSFGYEPDISLADVPPAENILLKDRYRVLWDTTIDGRLNRESVKQDRRAEFERAFAHLSPERREQLFGQLWSGPRPAHGELLELSKKTFDVAPNIPGAPCPLCKFPTFEWANEESLKNGIVTAIQAHFPKWSVSHGVCARCTEIYGATPMEMPKTLFV